MQQSDHSGRPFWDNLVKINSLKMTFSAGDAVSHQYKKSHDLHISILVGYCTEWQTKLH
jgi:hypothetical protein